MGLPVDEMSLEELMMDPVSGFRSGGIHEQMEGTWSYSSGLSFCLAETLIQGYDISNIATGFIQFARDAYWSARDEVFDLDPLTLDALQKISGGTNPRQSGSKKLNQNQSYPLGRLLPLIIYLHAKGEKKELAYQKVLQVLEITHAHPITALAGRIYYDYVSELLSGTAIVDSYAKICQRKDSYTSICPEHISEFESLLSGRLPDESPIDLDPSGFIVSSLEIAIYSLIRTHSFRDAVLLSISLGEFSSLHGSIVGGLAGIFYGLHEIPQGWQDELAKKDNIVALADRFSASL